MAGALILTYHAVEHGPAPLCVDPGLFEAHADVIADSRVRSVTVRELAETLATTPAEDVVAITFDDGFVSAASVAAPLLLERGLVATLFCVAGHLGAENDWRTARDGGYQSELADAAALSELAARGFEIGSHGTEHAPLAGAPEDVLRREVVDSRAALEAAVGVQVTSYAYPYGALPSASGKTVVIDTYHAACTTKLQRLRTGSDPYALPRVDAHYVRKPELLQRALSGQLGAYLRARGRAARVRRAIFRDYATRDESRSLTE